MNAVHIISTKFYVFGLDEEGLEFIVNSFLKYYILASLPVLYLYNVINWICMKFDKLYFQMLPHLSTEISNLLTFLSCSQFWTLIMQPSRTLFSDYCWTFKLLWAIPEVSVCQIASLIRDLPVPGFCQEQCNAVACTASCFTKHST